MSAVAGGTMFYRWRRLNEEDRGRVWRLYGWYSGLMAFGSCVGAVAWTFDMISYVNFFEGYKIPNESQEELGQKWYSAFIVTYTIEFLCLTSAKLMVLGRMSVFLALEGTGRRWAAAGRFVMAVVVLCNAVALAGSIAAAANYQKDGTDASAYTAYSVQRICDASVLLLIVVAFVVVGVLSARRVSARLLDVDAASAAAATGRALRWRMLGTTAFVFVAFLLRSMFSTFHAVAFVSRDVDEMYATAPFLHYIFVTSCTGTRCALTN